MTQAPTFNPKPQILQTDFLRILPWEDPITNAVGYDPRSFYVEMFWLPVLGPSCIWLIRRLSLWLEKYPAGFELDMHLMAKELGLGSNQKTRPLKRTFNRCADFGIMHLGKNDCIFLKQKMPQISLRLLNRFSPRLIQAHNDFCESNDGQSALQAYFKKD